MEFKQQLRASQTTLSFLIALLGSITEVQKDFFRMLDVMQEMVLESKTET